MTIRPSDRARLVGAVGILLAAVVPLLLLLTWGHIDREILGPQGRGIIVDFNGSFLPKSTEVALIALAGVVVAIGLLSLVRKPYPVLLVGCCLAKAAGGVLVCIQLSRDDLFPPVVKGGGALNRRDHSAGLRPRL